MMKQGGVNMRRVVCGMMTVLLLTGYFAGCGIFNDDTGSRDGWEKVSLPAGLKGVWFLAEIQQFTIESDQVTVNNREWGINRVEMKGDEHRLLLENGGEYVALYFMTIASETVYSSTGNNSISLYAATQAARTDWVGLTKGE